MPFGFGLGARVEGKAPLGGPSLALVFAGASTLDPRITFTRNSTATYFNASGVLSSASANTPRFDYDPVTLAARGLLIEEQRTNLLTYSEQFDNAAWTKSGATVTANAVVSPDGTTTADKLVEDTSSTGHDTRQSVSKTAAATTYSFTIYAKTAGRSLVVYMNGASFANRAEFGFNLNSGAASTPNNVGGFTSASASIVSIGNGWYRCVCTATTDASAAVQCRAVCWNGITSISSAAYTGDGTSGIYIWGAQLEAGAFATSYIPTTSAQATRIADSATMTGADFSGWYNQSEGTLFMEVAAAANTLAVYGGVSNGATATNAVLFDTNASNIRAVTFAESSAVSVLSLSATGTVGVFSKLAATYKTDDFAAVRNAGTVQTDTAGAVPAGVTQLDLGRSPNAAAVTYINGCIKRFTYYPRRLTNAELQGITT